MSEPTTDVYDYDPEMAIQPKPFSVERFVFRDPRIENMMVVLASDYDAMTKALNAELASLKLKYEAEQKRGDDLMFAKATADQFLRDVRHDSWKTKTLDWRLAIENYLDTKEPR